MVNVHSNHRRIIKGLAGLLVIFVMTCALSLPAFAGVQPDSLSAHKVRIYYRWDRYSIDSTYMGNAVRMHELDSILNRSRSIVDSLSIVSSASPEGNVRYNDRLSRNRGMALQRHLESLDRRGAIRAFNVVPLGSNFPEFLSMLDSTGRVPYSRDIISEFKSHPGEHPDSIYRRVMRLRGGYPYSYIKRNVLPYLRYAEIEVYSRPGFPPLPEPQFVMPVAGALKSGNDGLMPLNSNGLDMMRNAHASSSRRRGYWYPALKTNLLYDVVTALNAEAEFPIGRRFSILVEDVFPWWKWGTNDKKYCFQLWSMGVEPRWWFRRTDRKDWLSGHFAGAYAMSGKYDLQWKKSPCYQGEYWSAGLTYGYAMPICKWLNMEFSVSAGYIRSDYRHYQPDEDYDHLYRDKFKVGSISWFGPTKLKVSLVLPLGKDSHNVKKI